MLRKIVLFCLRLGVYLSTLGLIYLHPGIAVRFDPQNLLLWFALVPIEHIIAFAPAPDRKLRYKCILGGLPIVFFPLFTGGFTLETLAAFAGVGIISFCGTFLLFYYPRWGKFTTLEPFFLVYICFKLLNFSRSGEETSGQSLGITQFIMMWTILSFLLNSVIVYLCLNPRGIGGIRREAALFGLGSVAVLVMVLLLPPDFVRNSVVDNLISEEIPKELKDSDDWGIPEEAEGGRNGRPTLPRDGSGQQPGLRGLSEHNWPSDGPGGTGDADGKARSRRRGRGGSGEDQQFTVMVVAATQEPVYMGDSFQGALDPVRGFLPTEDEPLNALPKTRLFTMWTAPTRSSRGGLPFERGRQREEVFSLSTLSQNFLPYRPVEVDPTVLSEETGPLKYIHRVRADRYVGNPLELVFARVRGLRNDEKEALAPYLEVPLREEDRAVFAAHLEASLQQWREHDTAGRSNAVVGTIAAILTGFSDYQYNVGMEADDTSIAGLVGFLRKEKTDGDCTEFSNTAAILGRLGGIPSRVVTGYLASNGLQTPAHIRGLAVLRSKIPALQEFPLDDLFLVTDAHAHSWPQFYVPDYGWLDFEATEFAIPPIGLGDGNMRDVVIPLFDENRVLAPVRAFPWKAVVRSLGILGAGTVIGAYALLYGLILLLTLGARRGGRAGAQSLYRLLLVRLAADGKPIKAASKTALEYARTIPDTADFAALYTELRWRDFSNNPGEQEQLFQRLQEAYSRAIKTAKRPGIPGFFGRIFSLRGLNYV